MKKILLFAMVILILMAGCDEKNKTNKPDINISNLHSVSDIPVNSGGELPDNFEPVNLLSIYQPVAVQKDKYYDLLTWQDYIYDKFGFELNIFYQEIELAGAPAVYYFNYNQDYPFSTLNRVFDYIGSGTAYDLAPYYKEYGWDTFIDSRYIEFLSDNGAIYAVPTAPNRYIIPRYYNKEYLDILNMEIPTDISSFRDYLVESKKIMQGDGIKYPMFIRGHSQFQSTADIFRAFGVYVNSERDSTISYNPNTKSFEDAVFSENIESALGFFRALYDDGLMNVHGEGHCENGISYKNPYIGDITKVNKNFATEYNFVFEQKINSFRKFTSAQIDYESVSGYYLSYINSNNVCEVRSDMGFYVFPRNIRNINGIVDLFNTIMTDNDNYADFLYGMENKNYNIIDGQVFPIIPDLGCYPGIRTITSVDDPNSSFTPNNIEALNGLSSDMFFESSIFYDPARFSGTGNTFYSSGSYKENLFLPCVSPSDAVKEYKEWFYKSGIHDVIKTLNNNIGTVPAYDYTP